MKRNLQTSKLFLIIITAAIIIVGGYLIYGQIFIPNNINFIEINRSDKLSRCLDGVPVLADRENLLPVAIMIENHSDSRPPSGLSKAQIVYEALTESWITRFLAIYDLSREIPEIGPIRSARPYFIDIAGEYGAMYVHSGGSLGSLERLKSDETVIDFNEYARASYFWRSQNRHAPHNLYTSSKLLKKAQFDYEMPEQGDFIAWNFSTSSPTAQKEKLVDTSTFIRINYSDNVLYQIVWRYNPDNQYYERWQAGELHQDKDGSQIRAKNIIIQYASTKVIDDIGRKAIDLSGEGRAVIFISGHRVNGSWQKFNNRTRFYNEVGEEIEFNRGLIWIEIVPGGFVIED